MTFSQALTRMQLYEKSYARRRAWNENIVLVASFGESSKGLVCAVECKDINTNVIFQPNSGDYKANDWEVIDLTYAS